MKEEIKWSRNPVSTAVYLIKLNAGILVVVPSDLEGVVDFFFSKVVPEAVVFCLQNEVADLDVLDDLWLLVKDVLGVILGDDVAEDNGEYSPSLDCGVEDACRIRKLGSLMACLLLVVVGIVVLLKVEVVGMAGAE